MFINIGYVFYIYFADYLILIILLYIPMILMVCKLLVFDFNWYLFNCLIRYGAYFLNTF